jgi:hypothetical protein
VNMVQSEERIQSHRRLMIGEFGFQRLLVNKIDTWMTSSVEG